MLIAAVVAVVVVVVALVLLSERFHSAQYLLKLKEANQLTETFFFDKEFNILINSPKNLVFVTRRLLGSTFFSTRGQSEAKAQCETASK